MTNVKSTDSVSTPQTVTEINEIGLGDGCTSIQMVAETENANKEIVRNILHDELNMKKMDHQSSDIKLSLV